METPTEEFCGEAVSQKEPDSLLARFCFGVFILICLSLCVFGLLK